MSVIKVILFDSSMQFGGWPAPRTAYDYIKWLHGVIDSVPLELRELVEINHFESDPNISTQVYYFRDKTEAEIDAEWAVDLEGKIRRRDQALAMVKRLQAEIDAEQSRYGN